jgi:serine/threonine protein kinase
MDHIGNGLRHIHKRGYVHLDIKPENILIDHEGTMKIADFGLTAPIAAHHDIMEGDKIYLAPELLEDQVPTPQADIYSLGLILLELAANIELPSQGDAWRALRSGHFEEIRFEDYISKDMCEMILSMLHPVPGERPLLDDIIGTDFIGTGAL